LNEASNCQLHKKGSAPWSACYEWNIANEATCVLIIAVVKRLCGMLIDTCHDGKLYYFLLWEASGHLHAQVVF
jgi:hypothetical protein